MSPIRVLLMADSHLGFDLPLRPRVERRRRGHDFLANHERALEAARRGDVDLVVHGGDVFHRSRVAPSLVYQAFQPLIQIADSGVPVFVVPGNHERSRIPHRRLAVHPNLHIFDAPGTRVVNTGAARVAVVGFPYERKEIRARFPQVLKKAGKHHAEADLRILCFHHCVEGATVGPGNYTFRNARDVIRCSDLPTQYGAVLSGHIHRHQVLERDLKGRPLPTPVFYPGSVERTAFAEMGEEKGFMLLEFEPDGSGGRLMGREFVRLPARPMVERELHPDAGSDQVWNRGNLEERLSAVVSGEPREAVLRVRIHGRVSAEARAAISAARVRAIAPVEMNLEVITSEDGSRHLSIRSRRTTPPSESRPPTELQLGPTAIQGCLFG